MPKTYYAFWSANNGASFSSYDALNESNNKHKLAAEIRAICRAKTLPGTIGKWVVFHRKNNDTPVLCGLIYN